MYIRYLAMAFLAVGMVTLTAIADDEKEKPKVGKGLFGDPEAIFSRMDADGDKFVSKEEFRKFFESLPQVGEKLGQFADRIFDRLDADGDGKISQEEMKKISELRGKIDPDKLGKLKEKLKDRLKDKE